MLSQLKNRNIKHIHGAKRSDFFMELLTSRLLFAIASILLITLFFYVVKDSYLSFLELTYDKSWFHTLAIISVGVLGFLVGTTVFTLIQATFQHKHSTLIAQKPQKERFLGGSTLTTVQYIFAIVMIVASAVVFKQFKYMQNKALGFNPDNLITVQFLDEVNYKEMMTFFEKNLWD